MTPSAAILRAPAKINLVLRVGPRRPDGYHEVVTLLARVDLADVIAVRPAPATLVSCPALPAGDTLVTRALVLLAEAAGHGGGFRVRIDKRIPVGAGLGGGSSDAATALAAANRLLPAPLPEARLHALAAEIGSDVPFFLGPPVAIGRGRGERLEPFAPLPPCAVVLARPEHGLATRDVYAAYVPTGRPLPSSIAPPADLPALAALVENDLAAPAVALEPACDAIRSALRRRGALAAEVTGSGSAVFGLFDDPERAARAADDLPGAAWAVRATLSDQ